LTQGFARRNHFRFSIREGNAVLNPNEPLILAAEAQTHTVDGHTDKFRNSGFYQVAVTTASEPKALIPLGSNYRWKPQSSFFPVCVVCRESPTEAPTLYFTKDFHQYTQLDDGRPDKRKGIEKELISWTSFAGQFCQGFLEKPVNFNPGKKYPVIIWYYANNTVGNYPIFISADRASVYLKDGYLLFHTDIHYILGHTGKSAYDCVVAGAEELKKLPFVDGNKIGIMGTSFGGYQTNYLVTHSSLFAAAAEGAGASDFFSYYGTASKDSVGFSYQASIENGQYRISGTPWSNREGYFENSPIFFADKVTTPLLMYHSNNDDRVPFAQGMELFMALRRLGKPAWLLDYNQGHGGPSMDPDMKKDFSIRTKQFFDHYLKGTPAPIWMTRGIPARLRGVESGLELDTQAPQP
jgi:dipeptidyl aminopeptidase/acylaminoacyl peptidase